MAALASAAVLAVIVATSMSSAATAAVQEGGAAPASANDTDIQLIAKQFGWDVDATARHMNTQAQFGLLVDTLAGRYPEHFAGASFAEKPGEPSQVMVKGQAPSGLVQLVTERRLDVKVVDGMRYSSLDQQRRSSQIISHLTKAGYREVGTAVLSSGVIQVAVPGDAKVPVQLPKELQDGVEVAQAPGRVVTDEVDVKGGVQVYGGGFQCTSGFSVRRLSDGLRGIATAAHCNGMTSYNAPGPDVAMTFRAQHNSFLGDMEWHSTAENEIDNYFASPTDERDV